MERDIDPVYLLCTFLRCEWFAVEVEVGERDDMRPDWLWWHLHEHEEPHSRSSFEDMV